MLFLQAKSCFRCVFLQAKTVFFGKHRVILQGKIQDTDADQIAKHSPITTSALIDRHAIDCDHASGLMHGHILF